MRQLAPLLLQVTVINDVVNGGAFDDMSARPLSHCHMLLISSAHLVRLSHQRVVASVHDLFR